jgi:hypothetical protein
MASGPKLAGQLREPQRWRTPREQEHDAEVSAYERSPLFEVLTSIFRRMLRFAPRPSRDRHAGNREQWTEVVPVEYLEEAPEAPKPRRRGK